jgi:dTDP-glucose 4,6-dehydratase
MTRVLLTGAGGAIGIHMVSHIMETTDWHVVGVDSFRHKGYIDRLSLLFKVNPQWQERFKSITHDLTAPFTSREEEAIGAIDYVINLASLSDVQASIDDPVTFVRNNSDIMLNMLELARWIRPKAFLHFSTDEVYGPAAVDQGHPEWDTILPSNPYAASKAAQEAYAIAWWRSYNVPVIITNTMNNFGETQAPSKYPAMVQSKLAKGEPVIVHTAADGQIGTRYYLHSRNAADAVLHILKNTNPYLHKPGHVDRPDRYNIVGDVQMDNLELAKKIAELMGVPLEYETRDFHSTNPGHDLHYGLNGAKLAASGWESPMTFEESLKITIDWQKRHPEWLR